MLWYQVPFSLSIFLLEFYSMLALLIPLLIPQLRKDFLVRIDEMDVQVYVTTPVGSMYQSELVVRNCPVIIQDKVFPADLVLLGI